MQLNALHDQTIVHLPHAFFHTEVKSPILWRHVQPLYTSAQGPIALLHNQSHLLAVWKKNRLVA